MREVWKGFIIALRRWSTMLLLTGMIAAACVVLSLALSDVLSQVAYSEEPNNSVNVMR